MPPARFWTLYAADAERLRSSSRTSCAPSALHSYELLRQPDNSRRHHGRRAARSPGNWLALSGAGPMSLVLTFYDTPIASSTGVADIELPQILKAGCNA